MERLPDMIHSSIRYEEDTLRRIKDPIYLDGFGCKVFSENDEDGIIEEIFNRIGTTNKTFIEARLEKAVPCNVEYLLLKGWNGYAFCSDASHYSALSEHYDAAIQNDSLSLIISDILEYKKLTVSDVDYISISDHKSSYFIAEKIDRFNPRVISVRYNAKIPPSTAWIAADDKLPWDGTDFFGASLKAYELMLSKKGYCLVGTNITGTTAFFVRYDLICNKFPSPATSANLYNPYRPYRFSESYPSDTFIGKTQQYINDPFEKRTDDCNIIFSSGFIAEDSGYTLNRRYGSIQIKNTAYIPRKLRLTVDSSDTTSVSLSIDCFVGQDFVLNSGMNHIDVIIDRDYIKNDIITIAVSSVNSVKLVFGNNFEYIFD